MGNFLLWLLRCYTTLQLSYKIGKMPLLTCLTCCLSGYTKVSSKWARSPAKPSLKITWRYSLKKYFLRNKTFLFFKKRKLKISASVWNWNLFLFFLSVVWLSLNPFSNRFWKFQLSILKDKKVLFLKKPLSISKQKSFVYWPNFLWRFWLSWSFFSTDLENWPSKPSKCQ